MSRIYDALKDAEREKSDSRGSTNRHRLTANDRRRSGRRALRVALFVYGRTRSNRPFLEAADSVGVNENGALLILSAQVSVGQRLILLNRQNGMEQECTVVRVGQRRYKMPVGVRFAPPAPEFWESPGSPSSAIPSSASRCLHSH